MKRVNAALAALALTAAGAGAVATAQSIDGSASTIGIQEWVVRYSTPDSALIAHGSIAAAGGRLTDEIASIGVARVMAPADFAGAVADSPGIDGVTRNRSVGNVRKGMPEVLATGRPVDGPRYVPDSVADDADDDDHDGHRGRRRAADPLEFLQWNMAMLGTRRAHRRQTGAGVTVGVIDTGINASHPDLAPNFSADLSHNFTVDREDLDGPCALEPDAACTDPADVDEAGHGTHVAGVIGAARNGIGITGVAPDVTLVNLRAGQDSGYFFLFETLAAIDAARIEGIDVVNMSFYTDPWLYNCERPDQVIGATTTPERLVQDVAEQRIIRILLLDVIEKARAAGVTMVAAAGNEAVDLAAPLRYDGVSPSYPVGGWYERIVTRDCIDLPAEAPGVIQVSAVGPSGGKADYSNYGLGDIDVAAPGGYFRDLLGTDAHRTPQNEILAPYPLAAGQQEGGFDAAGTPIDPFYVRWCDVGGECSYYQYLQGTSMASPHAAGVAALVVGALRKAGRPVTPDEVAAVLARTATKRACPDPPTIDYTLVGRPPDWNAECVGTEEMNGFYGAGIVNAAHAVRSGRRHAHDENEEDDD